MPRLLLLMGLALAVAWSAALGQDDEIATEEDAAHGSDAAGVEPETDAQLALMALVPQSGDADLPGSLLVQEEARLYPRDRLADYIDGDAESFYPHGVGDTAAAGYSLGRGVQLEMDVFDMTTDLGAFGVWSQRRPPDAQVLDIGAAACASGRQLSFVSGRYYVVVRTIARRGSVSDTALELAQVVCARIGGSPSLPVDLALLPTERQAPWSVGYAPSDFLALGGMPAFFYASYLTEGEEPVPYRVAVSAAFLEPVDAGIAFGKMRESLESRAEGATSGSDAPPSEGTAPWCAGTLRYRGAYFATVVGCRVVLVVGLPEGSAREIVAKVREAVDAAE